MELKESLTLKNLETAFLRESGAFNEYTYYAFKAKNEGLQEIYNTFNTFAANEQAHAKVIFDLWHGVTDTKGNLQDSADLENHERTVMYADFIKTAKKEGFIDIAGLFSMIAEVEEKHEQEYKRLFNELKNKTLFKAEKEIGWKCLNCGHIFYGKEPLDNCPLCSFPKTYSVKVEQN